MSILSIIGGHAPPREEPNRAAEPNPSIEKGAISPSAKYPSMLA
jgi:hypothetical protein